MSDGFTFRIIDEKKKKIELTYKGKTLRLRLKVKRSFTVLKKILETYPKYLNIHDLDRELNDPNRAHSALRIEDGFANFLEEKRGKKKVMHVKINLDKLFEYVRIPDNPNEFVCLAVAMKKRGTLSSELKAKIYKKFKGRCNITGFKVYDNVKGNKFLKGLMVASYDHRRPISKGGSDNEENIQLICGLANSEKNKICNICDGVKCEQCALAYPEHFDVIIPTGQNIGELRLRATQKE